MVMTKEITMLNNELSSINNDNDDSEEVESHTTTVAKKKENKLTVNLSFDVSHLNLK